jgi:membrane-associated phospholipid phosphatase
MLSPAEILATGINPVLTGCLFLAPFVGPRTSLVGFWGRAALGIGVSVLVAEAGKRGPIWPGHPSFPSGHETFCLAAVTLLILHNPRWAVVAVPLALVLAWALVAAHYHYPIDVAGSLLVAPPIVLFFHWLWRRLKWE